jgi:spore germination protein
VPRAFVALAVVLVLAVTVAAAAAATHRWPFGAATAHDPPLRLVAASPYWNIARDAGKIIAHKGDFTEVAPWIYGIDDGGDIVSMVQPANRGLVDEALAEMKSAKLPVVPTISNTRGGQWDYATIIRVLRDPVLRARHVNEIVRLVRSDAYSGVDIDYENFRANDRGTFSAFITELATALHRAGKTLSVDVFAKATDRGYDERNIAQDYRAIGSAADTIRIMAYDWNWNSSEPGPIAPLGWVQSVLNYALTQIAKRKIVLGIPAYGYDWVGKSGTLVSWLQAYGLAQKYGAPVHWDAHAQSPWLTYRAADGRRHVVWFENAYSSLAKLALARRLNIGGAYLWLAGDEDDLMWQRLSPSDIDHAAKRVVSHDRMTASP